MKNYLSHFATFVDFPKPGVLFYDFSPLLRKPKVMTELILDMAEKVKDIEFDVIAGIDARGFIFGAMLASHLGKGFVMMRKTGKLPGVVFEYHYDLEYGRDSLCVQQHILKAKEKVLIIDDVLGTGGTAKAATALVEAAKAQVAALVFVLEVPVLKGREVLKAFKIVSLNDI